MLVRVVRTVVGAGLLLGGLPLLLAGGALWVAVQHQDPAGGYAAPLSTIRTEGYAVVASDVDALLRREAPFTRDRQTTVRLTARTGTGPAFIGLAPAADVTRYLAGVPYARVDEVRLTRGPLPVVTVPVDGAATPDGEPGEQPFWQSSSRAGTLEWSPSELRGQRLALVVMDPDGRAPLAVDLTARVHPQWLSSTTLGLLVLGTVLLLVAVVALAWPSRPREIVYVVPPAQLPELAAQLGAVPRVAIGSLVGTLAVEPYVPPSAEPAPPTADLPEPDPSAGSPSVGAPPAAPEPRTPAEGSVPGGPRGPAAGHLPPDPVPELPDLEWPPPDPREPTTAPTRVPAASGGSAGANPAPSAS